MKTILFTASLLFAPLCLADAEREHLIYEADCFVDTELRCPSPDGQSELVYRGSRHAEREDISVVNDMVIILKNGREIPLGALFCAMPIYKANIIRQPWSPDGKWLAFPSGRFYYCFYPVAALHDNCFSSKNFRMLSVTQPFMHTIGAREDGSIISEIRQAHFILEGGHWEADGSFTFRAGLSGYLAPYSASVSDDGVIYKQEGDMFNHRP